LECAAATGGFFLVAFVGEICAKMAVECNAARDTQYAAMAGQLAAGGFDKLSVAAAADNFVRGADGSLVPKHYDMPPWELQYPAVRLHCFVFSRFDATSSALSVRTFERGISDPGSVGPRAVAFAAQVKVKLQSCQGLSTGALQVYTQALDDLHITLFHPSAPSQPRPFASGERLRAEEELSRQLVASFGADRRRAHGASDGLAEVELVVDRILMTPGGVLLLVFQPKDSSLRPSEAAPLDHFRAKLRTSFPDASPKQTKNIYHASILRMVGEAPDIETAKEVAEMCEQFSARLKGTSVWFNAVTYVRELGIIALEGERVLLPLDPGA